MLDVWGPTRRRPHDAKTILYPRAEVAIFEGARAQRKRMPESSSMKDLLPSTIKNVLYNIIIFKIQDSVTKITNVESAKTVNMIQLDRVGEL